MWNFQGQAWVCSRIFREVERVVKKSDWVVFRPFFLEVLDLSIQHMMSAFRFDYFPNFDPIVQSSFHHRFLIVFICSYIFSLQKYKKLKEKKYTYYLFFQLFQWVSKIEIMFLIVNFNSSDVLDLRNSMKKLKKKPFCFKTWNDLFHWSNKLF